MMKRFGLMIAMIGLLALSFAPAASAQACVGAPPNVLQNGDTGQVAQAFSSVRADIGSQVVLDTMYSLNGDTFTVIAEPVCAGPHWWLNVDFDGTVGWAAEGYLNQYWLEPAVSEPDTGEGEGEGTGGTDTLVDPISGVTYTRTDTACTGAPMPRLEAGETTFVAQSYSSLRAGVHSNIIYRIVGPGTPITVVDGPFCAFGPYNWYSVEVDGVSGWVTEGTGSSYWLTEGQ